MEIALYHGLSSRTMVVFCRILVIQDVSPRDSGVYECKASNNFGESRTSTTVIVAGKLSLLERRQNNLSCK